MHNTYLLQALELATRYKGFCAPNPSVGAVIVKEGKVIGEGYHCGPGTPHAEVMALAQAGSQAKGSTVYVTLEPCCHFGRTPPCVDALKAAKVAEVIFGYQDPNPIVSGRGQEALIEQGIPCKAVALDEINEFYKSYSFWMRFKRPWVTVKLAISLDGKTAGPGGRPVKISGSELDAFTHQQRKQSDAILTTAKTVKQDDPKLNVRLNGEIFSKPVYLLDTQLSLPLTATVLQTASRLTVFHGQEISQEKVARFQEHSIQCIAVPEETHGLSLPHVLKAIGSAGVQDLWVEVGGQCFQSFVTRHLAQKAYLYVGTRCLGMHAQPAFVDAVNLFKQAETLAWRTVGSDALCEVTWPLEIESLE